MIYHCSLFLFIIQDVALDQDFPRTKIMVLTQGEMKHQNSENKFLVSFIEYLSLF